MKEMGRRGNRLDDSQRAAPGAAPRTRSSGVAAGPPEIGPAASTDDRLPTADDRDRPAVKRSAPMEGESNIYGSEFAEAVIDNPGGAKRTIRFETGRLAKQAAGSVTIYQGDTLVLSAA